MDWRCRAVCRDEDPAVFFPLGIGGSTLSQVAQAKAVCRGCEVREDCLASAMGSDQDCGVWGGLTEDERRTLKRGARVGARG